MGTTAPSPIITPDDLLRMRDGERHLELIRGQVRERAKGVRAALVSGEFQSILHSYTDPRGDWQFGWTLGYHCFPGEPNTVRRASVTVIKAGRLSREKYAANDPFSDIVPDVVIEVVGFEDKARDLEESLGAWLAAGVKLLWEVYPTTHTVRVHQADGTITFLKAADTLTAPDVLPGFACPVADLFRLPGDPAPAG